MNSFAHRNMVMRALERDEYYQRLRDVMHRVRFRAKYSDKYCHLEERLYDHEDAYIRRLSDSIEANEELNFDLSRE